MFRLGFIRYTTKDEVKCPNLLKFEVVTYINILVTTYSFTATIRNKF